MKNQDDIEKMPGRKQVITVFGVEYLHIALPDGDDLYVTDFRGNHILLSVDSKGTIITNKQGLPEGRVCNFELLGRSQ